MNGPRSSGREYTGKHRQDSGPGVLPPAWAVRPESCPRPAPGARAKGEPGNAPSGMLRTEASFRSDPGLWPDAG